MLSNYDVPNNGPNKSEGFEMESCNCHITRTKAEVKIVPIFKTKQNELFLKQQREI